jgi:hypothetical protein
MPHDHFRIVSQVTRDSEGHAMRVRVRRNPEGYCELTLVPARWEGRGLLGCALQPFVDDASRAAEGVRTVARGE